jgi:superfamily II DNA or RNA helicase
MELREYQKSALDKIRTEYSKGNRSILVVSPTGSGKGVILSELIRSANNKGARVLFLVHRREILFQVSRYMGKYSIPHGVILSGEEYDPGNMVELATVQTLYSRMKRRDYDAADIIIIDEAHNSTAPTYRSVIERHKGNMVVGFTATPCRQSGHGLGTLYDALVNVATIEDLTRQGYLVPVRYYAPSEPDLSGVKITAGDYNEKQLDVVMRKPKLVGDIVENWLRIAKGQQTVVFTTTVAHSVAVCDAFMFAGVNAEHVDGRTDKDEREAILNRFTNGDTTVLCNCCVFTEGVDIPSISCVVMARPTKSLALYMQTIGRGMRPHEGKQHMTYIDHAGACYEHGPVHEITEWSLDESTKNTNKKNDERKERESRPITCEMCCCVYTGRIKCPDCGTVPDVKKMPKDVEYIDATLGEVCFKTKKVKKKASNEDKQKWYAQLLGYAETKGYSTGWAAHKYRDKFGVWPRNVDRIRQKPEPEVLAWIRGQAARAAIARRYEQKRTAS